MDKELKKIKKLYGEAMMHFCRDNFALILETPDLLLNILTSNFNSTHELYKDLEKNNLLLKFKEYIFTKVNKEEEKEVEVIESPEELLAKVGYDLYECLTEEDIQKFRKYYAKGEELCTFRTYRLETNRVFFAVKKNVDEIKRENFKYPKRQDEYGTSVISIQFTKDGTNTLSIKNRYNHTVENPDATFSNDLDNIIPGLTKSFEKYYKLKQLYKNDDFEIIGYIMANDGKYYKYNYEIHNTYYCPDNIIIDNFNVKKYPKEKYLILDYFILDLEQKEMSLYDGILKDSFPKSIGKIKKVEIKKEDNEKKVLITPLDGEIIEISLDKLNRIIGYKNNNVKEIYNYFLNDNYRLKSLEMNNVVKINNRFLINNIHLKEINLPKVEYIEDAFILNNECLEKVNMPNLKEVGDYFLWQNLLLKELYLPNLKQTGMYCLNHNESLQEVLLPNLEKVGHEFLTHNKELVSIKLPKLQTVDKFFLTKNEKLKEAYFPNLMEINDYFFVNCQFSLKIFIAPKLKQIGCYKISEYLGSYPNLEKFVTADGNFSLQRKRYYSQPI